MNLELVEKMTELLNQRRERRNELAEVYKTSRGEQAKRIYREVDELVKGNVEINTAIKNVKKANNEYIIASTEEELDNATNQLLEAQNELYALAEKYGVDLTEEVEEEIEEEIKTTEDNKSNLGRNLVLGSLAFAMGAGLGSCINQDSALFSTTSDESKDDEEEIEEEVEKLNAIINADTEIYGMSTALTDASDETQVMQRANDIYNMYVNVDGMPQAIKQELSVERLANYIRMCNGEFALEDGKIDYNESMHDEMANIIATYHNSTSLAQNGTNLQFKPICVFFENDSLAHHSAVKADELVKVIYEDIKNNDVEKFQKDSVAWGEFVRDTFIYNDMTGETISLWSVENEHKYPLISSIISVYAPSIMEYSIGVDLASGANSKNMFGNSFGICIPFCYNADNELEYMPLSEMIYHINCTPMNTLAKRAGYAEEWAENNDPIMLQTYQTTKDYFASKYELEVGKSLKLK